MESKKIITWIVLVFVLLGIVTYSIYKVSANTEKNDTYPLYSSEDREKPKLSFNTEKVDVGHVKLKDTSRTVFQIKNKGTKPLHLFEISSTCMCTFGQLTTDKEKSALFGMHDTSNYSLTLQPGKSAQLVLIYKPSLMPVKGAVERAVVVHTNDPLRPEQYFTIHAYVD